MVGGHEAVHAMDEESGDLKKYSEEDRDKYADNFGSNLTNYTDMALDINGYDDGMASSNNHVGNRSEYVTANNAEFKPLDKNKGDNLKYDQLSTYVGKINGKDGKYGIRVHPLTGERKKHKGIDVIYEDEKGDKVRNAVIRAAGDGVVIKSHYEGVAGNMVKIRHGDGIESMYFHADKLLVKKGDKVKEGQPVIVEGKSGGVSGEHLHFVVKKNGKKIDPTDVNVGKYDKLEDTPFFKAEKAKINE